MHEPDYVLIRRRIKLSQIKKYQWLTKSRPEDYNLALINKKETLINKKITLINKKRTYQQVDFLIPPDLRIKMKRKAILTLQFCQRAEKVVEYGDDSNINCRWSTWNNLQWTRKVIGQIYDKRKSKVFEFLKLARFIGRVWEIMQSLRLKFPLSDPVVEYTDCITAER